MIPCSQHVLQPATREDILRASSLAKDPDSRRILQAIRRVKQACGRNAARLEDWATTGNPILEQLRGVLDPRTRKPKSATELARRWLTKANEIAGCSATWQRTRCCRCGALRAHLLVCNQRFCPRCVKRRRRDLEQRVLQMLQVCPRDCSVFAAVLTLRTPPTLLGSSRKLFRKLRSFLRDPYIRQHVAGGGRKFEATKKSGRGPHPHLHLLLFVRRRAGHRPRLDFAELVSAWQRADAGDQSHCRCRRRGRRGKPGLCCHSSYDNTKKDLFDVCDDPACPCLGCDVEPSSQHVDWTSSQKPPQRLAREVGKYTAKEIADPTRYGLTDEDLADLLLETHGLRAWQTFGVAYGSDRLEQAIVEAAPCPGSARGEPCDWHVFDLLPGDAQAPRPPPGYFEIPLAS